MTQANRYVAEYFETVIDRGQLPTYLSAEKLASLLNGMLLGYAVIEFTSEFHELWKSRDDFLENLITLFLHGAVAQVSQAESNAVNSTEFELAKQSAPEIVRDLPANLIHEILQKAKKAGPQEYALMYVLFGAGVSPAEIICLERSHLVSNAHQQLLQITQGLVRQVPVNQRILGKRYGSYARNPLTQWLKSRKDSQSNLFLNQTGKPLSIRELQQYWQQLTDGLLTPTGHFPTIEQAQQTWCVEMLMRGVSLENLCILTGWDAGKLRPYIARAREKAALEQAIRLDQKA